MLVLRGQPHTVFLCGALASLRRREYANPKWGDCIPASNDTFDLLRSGGYNPIIVEGQFEVDKPHPHAADPMKPYLIDHTWVECEGFIFDVSIRQFNDYMVDVPHLEIVTKKGHRRYHKEKYYRSKCKALLV